MEIGNTIYLTCNATIDNVPSDEVDWFKDGVKVVPHNNGRISVTKHVSSRGRGVVSVLTISSAYLHDTGKYVCRTSDWQITSTRVNVLKSGMYYYYDVCH